MADLVFVTISEFFLISELSLSEAYYLAHYNMQNILKAADSIIEKQEAHELSKNLVWKQSPSKGSGDENKTNAFITWIEEQRHHYFSHIYSS